jgi:hypothetical protein
MSKHWKRYAFAALAAIGIGLGGALAAQMASAADDCCYPGSPCCYPGSPCCADAH